MDEAHLHVWGLDEPQVPPGMDEGRAHPPSSLADTFGEGDDALPHRRDGRRCRQRHTVRGATTDDEKVTGRHTASAVAGWFAGGNGAPQCRQKRASGVWPSVRQAWQVRVVVGWRMRCAVISDVTMPVGTASVPQPSSIIIEAIRRPRSVLGVMSPKPTVVMVVMAQ